MIRKQYHALHYPNDRLRMGDYAFLYWGINCRDYNKRALIQLIDYDYEFKGAWKGKILKKYNGNFDSKYWKHNIYTVWGWELKRISEDMAMVEMI